MTTDEFLQLLRAATEDDVLNALNGAWIEPPITTPVEALELFNIMLDDSPASAIRRTQWIVRGSLWRHPSEVGRIDARLGWAR